MGSGVHAIVLAAGAGRRFGGGKQLAPLGGRPLLEHALRAAAAAPVDGVVVALGADAERVAAAVDLHGARPVVVAGWAEGVAASLRAGLEAIGPDAQAAVIVLGDQPAVDPATIARVIEAWRGSGAPAARAVHAGRPGHPVVVARSLFPRLLELRGDRGAGALLAQVPVAEVECGEQVVLDVDTPGDLDGGAPG
jgi:CTP:molybdopterin cytidylyltransferase MocA